MAHGRGSHASREIPPHGWVTLNTSYLNTSNLGLYFIAARIGDFIYLAGGRNVDDSLIDSIDRYDVVNNVWTANVFQWSNAISDAGAFAINDLLYFVGGYDASYNTLANLTSLNINTGEWKFDYPKME